MEQIEELMPKHIAIIMDGNRRWAKQRNLPVKMGHKEGAETLKKIIIYLNIIHKKKLQGNLFKLSFCETNLSFKF